MLRPSIASLLCAVLALSALAGCSSSRSKVDDYRVSIRIERSGVPLGSVTVAGTVTEDGKSREVSSMGSPASFPLRANTIGAELFCAEPDAEIIATLIAPDIRPLVKMRRSGSQGAKIRAVHERGEITESLEIDVIPQGTVSAAAVTAPAPAPTTRPDAFHNADGTTTAGPSSP